MLEIIELLIELIGLVIFKIVVPLLSWALMIPLTVFYFLFRYWWNPVQRRLCTHGDKPITWKQLDRANKASAIAWAFVALVCGSIVYDPRVMIMASVTFCSLMFITGMLEFYQSLVGKRDVKDGKYYNEREVRALKDLPLDVDYCRLDQYGTLIFGRQGEEFTHSSGWDNRRYESSYIRLVSDKQDQGV